MYFIAMVIQLRSRSGYRPSGNDGRWAHAAVFHAISKEDSRLGKYLHDTRQRKRLTIAVVEAENDGLVVRLTFLDQEGLLYLKLLNNVIMRNGEIRLGETKFTVKSIDINGSPWAGISTWGDLLSDEIGRKVNIHFPIPTAISKHDVQGVRYFSLFPDPKDLFPGLYEKWQKYSGPLLPDDLIEFVQSGGVVVSKHSLNTVVFKNIERTQIGFVGNVIYEIRTDNHSYIRAINGLSRFAFYSGVGYQTARGMGAVQVSIYN